MLYVTLGVEDFELRPCVRWIAAIERWRGVESPARAPPTRSSAPRSSTRLIQSEINITPLIDVLLVHSGLTTSPPSGTAAIPTVACCPGAADRRSLSSWCE
jgi:hypothetical protein